MHVGNKGSLSKLITAYKIDWKVRLASRLVLIGLLYGYISALHNQNPYYPVPHSQTASLRKLWSELEQCNECMSRAYTWRPSPFWFPSYLLCKVPPGEPGIGIFWSKSGYLFRSYAGLYLYRFSSTVLSGALGLILAIIIINIKKAKQRKKQTESVGPTLRSS
jgi:hypothetical protein